MLITITQSAAPKRLAWARTIKRRDTTMTIRIVRARLMPRINCHCEAASASGEALYTQPMMAELTPTRGEPLQVYQVHVEILQVNLILHLNFVFFICSLFFSCP